MPSLFTPPNAPSTPNVFQPILVTGEYVVGPGEIRYDTTNTHLFSFYSGGDGSAINFALRNSGTLWNDFANESYVLNLMNWGSIENRGLIVAHSSAGQAQALVISSSFRGGLSNSGSIYALSDSSLASALRFWDSSAVIRNAGVIAAWAPVGALGVYAENGGEIINQSGGAILAEGGSGSGPADTTAIWLLRGHRNLAGYAISGFDIANYGIIEARTTNSGTNSYGIKLDNLWLESMVVLNHGVIRANVALFTSDFSGATSPQHSRQHILNGATGLIEGEIQLALGNDLILNNGRINGLVSLGGDNDIVVNTGTIAGAVALGLGNDVYVGMGGTHIGRVLGEDGADLLIGTAAQDSLDGGAGDDVLFGGGGDSLTGGMGRDQFVLSGLSVGRTEAITDFVSGSDVIDLRPLSPTSVSINGSTITALTSSGSVTIQVTGAVSLSDIITASPGSVVGTSGDDSLVAGSMTTNLQGGSGNDLLVGGSFNDQLDGGSGQDVMWGGEGDDLYVVDSAFFIDVVGDSVVELADGGTDTVHSTANFTLPDNVENLTLFGGTTNPLDGGGNALANILIGSGGVNHLNGGDGNDSIYAGDLADVVDGGAGADLLLGEGGDDVVYGLTGNDTIVGGLGADNLTGGSGRDTFRDTAEGLNGDMIIDFGSGDTIVISDATLANFTFNLTGSILTYTGGSLILFAPVIGSLVASAASGGGVQLALHSTATSQVAGANFITTAFGSSAGAGGWSSDDLYPRLLADVNGDDRADIVGFGNDGVYVSFAQANGTFGTMNPATTAFGLAASAGGWSSNDRYPREIADVNGDGKADIIGFGNDGVYVSLGQANGTFAPPTAATTAFGFSAGAGGWSSNDRYPRVIGDVNGDNRSDIIGFGNDGVYVSLGQANGTLAPPTAATTAFGFNPSAGGWSSNNTYPRMVGDVNIDGRTDIVGFGNHGVYVSLGQVNGTFAPPTLGLSQFGAQPPGGSWLSYDQYPRELADVNDDGKLDIIGFGNDGVYIAYGNGNGTFQASVLDINYFGYGPQAGNWTSGNTYPRHLADINGDGAADIVGFYSDGVHVALSNGLIF